MDRHNIFSGLDTASQLARPAGSEVSIAEANPVPPSSLLRLPREVRDQMLEYAFGEDPLVFHHDGYTVFLHKGRPHIATLGVNSSTTVEVTNGLPQWLMSCKQICAEGMNVLVESRSFECNDENPAMNEASGEVLGIDTKSRPNVSRSSWPNTLLLNNASIRTLQLRPSHNLQFCTGGKVLARSEISSAILARWLEKVQTMQSFAQSNLACEMEWDRWWHTECLGNIWLMPKFTSNEANLLQPFDRSWEGRFRKFHLTLVFHGKSGDGEQKMTALAEQYAGRLVGGKIGDVKKIWSQKVELAHPRSGYLRWVKVLFVERRA